MSYYNNKILTKLNIPKFPNAQDFLAVHKEMSKEQKGVLLGKLRNKIQPIPVTFILVWKSKSIELVIQHTDKSIWIVHRLSELTDKCFQR